MHTIRSTKKLDQGACVPTLQHVASKIYIDNTLCILKYTGCSGQCVLENCEEAGFFALVANFVCAGDPRILSLALGRLQERSLQWCNSPLPEEGGTVYAEHKQTSYMFTD